MAPAILLVSDDLLFASRVSAAAGRVGAPLRTVKNPEAAIAAARADLPRCLILDLAVVGSRLGELLVSLRELPIPPRVVAYGSHVDVAGLRAAAEAGCDLVLPRSRFVELVDSDLPQWLSPQN